MRKVCRAMKRSDLESHLFPALDQKRDQRCRFHGLSSQGGKEHRKYRAAVRVMSRLIGASKRASSSLQALARSASAQDFCSPAKMIARKALAACSRTAMVGATEPEIEAAVHTVIAALAHPLMRRAASVAASDLRRETPVLLRQEDGTLVEGVVDLAFREEAADFTGWTVVDFKTDRELELRHSEYTTQVALYAEAIGRATGSYGNRSLACYLIGGIQPDRRSWIVMTRDGASCA